MLKIRLRKIAHGKNLTYQIVVTDSTKSAKSGGFIEKLGFYRPQIDSWDNKYLFINFDRASYWLSKGATMTSTVFTLVKPLFVSKPALFKEN